MLRHPIANKDLKCTLMNSYSTFPVPPNHLYKNHLALVYNLSQPILIFRIDRTFLTFLNCLKPTEIRFTLFLKSEYGHGIFRKCRLSLQ